MKRKRGKETRHTHAGGATSECIHDGCFAEAERVKEYILRVGGDKVVNVNRLGLRVTLNATFKLAQFAVGPQPFLEPRRKKLVSGEQMKIINNINITVMIRWFAHGRLRPV